MEKRKDIKTLILQFEQVLMAGEKWLFSIEELLQISSYYVQENNKSLALKTIRYGLSYHAYSVELWQEKIHILSFFQDFNRAKATIIEALNLFPLDTDILIQKAILWIDTGQFDAGKIILEDLQSRTQNNEEVLFQLGNVALLEAKMDTAITFYKQAIEINIDHQAAFRELIFILEENKKLGEELIFFEELLDQNYYSYRHWYCLGYVYEHLSSYKKALQAFDYCYALNDQYEKVWYRMGNCYQMLKKPEQAIKSFKIALSAEGPRIATYNALANIFELQDEFGLAIKYYSKSLKLNPTQTDVSYCIGQCLSEQEKWLEAIHYFNNVLKLEPDYALAWQAIALAEYQLGNINSSIDAWEEACMLNPTEIDNWLNWSTIYFDLKDYDQASTLINRGLQECEAEWEMALLYYRNTVYLYSAGRYQEAITNLELALSLDFELHSELFDFFPTLTTHNLLLNIINQYRTK